jgi:hypothetical protein
MKMPFLLTTGLLSCLLFSGCFFATDQEFIAMRNDILPRGEVSYEKEFQHKFGRGILGFASNFMEDSDPEGAAVKALLKDLQGVQIGVYKLQDSYEPDALKIQTERLTERMIGNGYYPVVISREGGEFAGIYAPDEEADTLTELVVCAMETEEVVLIQVTGNLNHLSTLIAQGETDLGI